MRKAFLVLIKILLIYTCIRAAEKSSWVFSRVPGAINNLIAHSEVLKTPFSGEDLRPAQALEATQILRSLNIKDYNFSKEIGMNEENRMSIIVMPYPIKYSKTSHNLIQTKSEEAPSACSIIKEGTHVVLFSCN